MSKGSRPRPFSISQDQFASNFDAIFYRPDPRELDDARAEDEAFKRIPVAHTPCHCYNCNKDRVVEGGLPYIVTRMILCPTCGNKRCPHATDHNLPCTNSNQPGQPGSRYQ